MGLYVDDGELFISHQSESELRESLVELASAYGWIVQQEYLISQWGRIDLCLSLPSSVYRFMVELKVNLSTARDVRRAFQQADGYHRALMSQGETNFLIILSAPKYDDRIIQNTEELYPSVFWCPVNSIMGWLGTHDKESYEARLSLIESRIKDMNTKFEVYRKTHEDLYEAIEKEQCQDREEGLQIQENPYFQVNTDDVFTQAQKIIQYIGSSRSGTIERLERIRGFTYAQAREAVDAQHVDWNQQAVQVAMEHLQYSAKPFSRSELIHQLESEGFTYSQAVHGVKEFKLH